MKKVIIGVLVLFLAININAKTVNNLSFNKRLWKKSKGKKEQR